MLDAGFLQQLLGARDVALGHRHVLRIEDIAGRHPLVADDRLIVHHHLHQALPVQRQLEGLAHARVAAQRRALGLVALADVDRDALVADLGDGRGLELLLGLQLLHVARREALDVIELARTQVGQAHGGVRDRRVDDLVEVDRVLVPVVRVALQHDAVLRHALDELERARAHRVRGELVAFGLRRLGRDHHAGAVGQLREQRRERRRQVQPHGQRVDHVHAGHGRQLAAPVGAGQGLVALDVELDRGGVELLAVLEGHAGTQLEGHRLLVRAPLVAGGELRDDVELLVDVEQLVAQRREDDAADEGARQRGVERIGILGEADAQRLGLRGQRRASEQEGQQGPQESSLQVRHGGTLLGSLSWNRGQ